MRGVRDIQSRNSIFQDREGPTGARKFHLLSIAARERIYFAERFFGDFLFSTSSIACPPGVACTLLSSTISFAVTS